MVLNVDFRKKKQEPTSSLSEDLDDFCSLSYKTRIIGFFVCLACGFLIVGFGYLLFILPSKGGTKIRGFVILYSLGNIVALCSTMFLIGPMNQLKKMFDKVRIIATIVYLSLIGLTLFFAFRKKPGLALICSILQMLALLWYGLSYIPYARTLVRKCLGLPDLSS